MKLLFLGGAESIGASCAYLEIDGKRWIADCGIRLRGGREDRLPDLSPLESLGAPSAILVTHAHLDHIGALPVLHQRFPYTPVYAAAPTVDLTRIQLLDSLRLMEEEATIDGELPLYSARTVGSLLEKMVPVKPLQAFSPDLDGPEVVFFPSGHILGACSLGISAREGRLFLSGDVSVDNQRTVPGMSPPRFQADAAVFESTYGNRLHPGRSGEEDRLVQTVAAAIAEGGKVLVPAFAIGRAQEVILILLRAQLLKQIPEFPIFVDGMVKAVCAVYSSHPWFLQSTLRKRIEKHGDPFFGVLDTVQAVKGKSQRREIAAGPPCAIVSSSGMLTGGPSPFYARALLEDARNLIAITGYQDEESPGRQLLDFAAGKEASLVLEGAEVKPKCRIASYALSGHASGSQIAALAGALRPADVFLVHGDDSARRELAELFRRERIGRVHLPRHGELLAPAARGKIFLGNGGAAAAPLDSRRRLQATGIGGPERCQALTEDELGALADHLRKTYRPGAAFNAGELFCIWNGPVPPDDREAAAFEERLRSSTHFHPHPTRLFEFAAAEEEPPEPAGAANVQTLIDRLDRELPAGAGLLKKSYQPGLAHMTLAFAFPDTVSEPCRLILEKIFRGSGWTYEIHPLPNLAALERDIRSALKDPLPEPSQISVRLEERRAAVYLPRPLPAGEETLWEEARSRLRERTGFDLELAWRPAAPPARKSRDAAGRLERNLAYQAIRDSFRNEPHAPYRIGMKPAPPGQDPAIEVAFISPEVGARYRGKLDRLGDETGWRLEVAAGPNQNAILDAARVLLLSLPVRKGPSFQPSQKKVSVTLASLPDPSAWERLAAEFHERTGWRLELG
ncbi:MAG: MBL fold metallo-hydrolase [Planctomycetes bacterium]|nr:MBL fold metallo-hydrolase [Planctomycetota bacterium]